MGGTPQVTPIRIKRTDSGEAPVAFCGDHTQHNALERSLPDDDDTGEDHPWDWLVELCRSQGIETTVDRLRAVPYQVVLSARVLARLEPRA
jgi:hypothetical protein